MASAQQIQFSKYSKRDIEQLKSLGCDVVRLPINLHHMTKGSPSYQLDPLFLNFLDQVVDWFEELEMHLILDNHSFDVENDTQPGVLNILTKVWTQLAAHYKDRSSYLFYEILNEPHGISDNIWNSIQKEVVRQIRTIDTKHTIIVGPANWNSYRSLSAMPIYEDENLMYTFHFYNPFIFTHQGASWVQPSMEDISIEDYTEQTIQCFPNPFSDSIEIRSAIEGKHDYKLYNTSGDHVSKNSFITDFRLSTASLPAGLYILKVETPGFQSFTKQLIKN